MFLLDTNIFLELFLEQEKADEVEHFLRVRSKQEFHISEFSVYSLGVILFRRNQAAMFIQFTDDVIVNGGIRLLRLLAQDMRKVAATAQRFRLDFDDAYQYVVAETHGLQIVSFDSDFERTEKGRKTPANVGD
jgi:uncharacterized protein